MATIAPGIDDSEPSLKQRWYVLIITMLVYTASIADRYVISTVLEPIRLEFHLNETEASAFTGLAQTLAYDPGTLLLDEPFGALDAQLKLLMQAELLRIWSGSAKTIVFVTHDQAEAMTLADRVVLMNQGRVEQVGSPQEVWDHPASPFVYGFLGDVNLFHGRAHEGEVQLGADHHGIRLQSPEHHAARDARAFAYVRPHDLDVQPYVQGAPGIAARLDRAIVVGPIARLELTRLDPLQAGDNAIIEAHLGAQEFRRLGLGDGDQVNVQLRNARVFVDAG